MVLMSPLTSPSSFLTSYLKLLTAFLYLEKVPSSLSNILMDGIWPALKSLKRSEPSSTLALSTNSPLMSPILAKMSEALDWAVGGGPACAQAVAPAIVPAATNATASLAAATRRLTFSAIALPPSVVLRSARLRVEATPRRPACQTGDFFTGEERAAAG